MPSTRASKSTTRSGLHRQSSPPPSTVLSARKRATSSVVDTTQAKKTKVDDEIPENLPADTGTKEKRASISVESGTDTGESDADTSSTNNTGNDEHQSDNEHGDEGIVFFIVIVSLYINFL